MSVVGSEPGMDARRVDADSSGAREGTARLSKRPLRSVQLRLSKGALRSPATGDESELLSADAVAGFAVLECDNVGKHFVQSALPRLLCGPGDVWRNDQVSQPCFD